MALVIFYVIVLASSLILVIWSTFLIKNYPKHGSKMIEGKKSLYVYIIVSGFGIVLSLVLLITWFMRS